MSIEEYLGRKVEVRSGRLSSGMIGTVIGFTDNECKLVVEFDMSGIDDFYIEDVDVLDSKENYNEGHDIEFLDRLYTVQLMLNELLINRKAAKRYGVSERLDQADSLLAEIYQEVVGKVL